jgi:hypothetical protein
MKKITTLLRRTKHWCVSSALLLACSIPVKAQMIQQYFGTVANNEVAVDVHAMPGGGYVAAGYITPTANCTQTDCYLFRVDNAGNLLWARRFGSANDEQLQRVTVAKNGEIICAGLGVTGGRYRGIAARFTAAGSLIWAKSYIHSGASDAIYFDVAELPNGNIALAGASEYATGSRRSLITVVSPGGVTNWSRTYPAASGKITELQGIIGIGDNIIAGGKVENDANLMSVDAATGATINWSRVYNGGFTHQTNYFGRLYVRNNRILIDGQNTATTSPSINIDHAITSVDLFGLSPQMEVITAPATTLVEFGTFYPITDTRFVDIIVPGATIYNPCAASSNTLDINITNMDVSTTSTNILSMQGDQQVYSIDIDNNMVYLAGSSRGGSGQIGQTDAYIVKYNLNQPVSPECIVNSGRVTRRQTMPSVAGLPISTSLLTPVNEELTIIDEAGIAALACGSIVSGACTDSCYWKVTGNNIIGGNNVFGTLTPDDVQIKTSATSRGIISSNGLLGWNTMAPTALLHVSCVGNNPDDGSAGSDVRFEQLEPGTGTILVIDPDGNVFNSGQNIGTGGGVNNLCPVPDMIPKINPAGDLDCSQIYDDGNSVGIATTGPFFYSWPGGLTGPTPPPSVGLLRLDINGVVRGLAFFATSDEKFKTGIKQIRNPFSIINNLNGKTYLWNEKAKKEMGADNTTQYGFIAQEVAKVLPEAVIIDTKGNYGVNYNSFIPLLVESQKELYTKYSEQKVLNEKLQGELDEIKGWMKELQNCCSQYSDAASKPVTDGNALYQNTPNPFGKETVIDYRVANMTNNANIIIFDMNGREVQRFNVTAKGKGSVTVNAEKMMAGMYLYALVVDGREVDTKKMVLIK